MELLEKHIEILKHTKENVFYFGDSKEIQELCSIGLMKCAGRKSFVPYPYFKLTPDGEGVLNDLAELNIK